MNIVLQFLVPLVTALALLGLFHLVAYLHLQLTHPDPRDVEDELHRPAN